MSLSDARWKFTQDVAALITFAASKGYKLNMDWVRRDLKTQRDFVKAGLSKTLSSKHLEALAVDFNIFYDLDGDGFKEYISTDEQFAQLGDELGKFWNSLDSHNECGFDWGWDKGHFQRNH